MGKKVTTEDFIRRAKEVHGDKYDYSKVEYKGIHTKVCIICPKHGEFWQTPSAHISQKQECPKCVNNNIRLTTEEFISRAKEVHGDKYDYSKAVYKSSFEKICIICPEHGEFLQTPSAHIKQKQGCPKCAKINRIETTNKKGLEKFIKDARKVHGDKYDYSKVIYNGINRNVCIICPEHGEFWQTPYNHTSKKCECPKCSGNARLTTEEFISRAKEIHGDKYDYSKVEFTSVNKKVCIICLEHSEFWVKASHFLGGHGCPKCAGNAKLTPEEFIRRAKEVHGDKYDYSKVECASTKKKVCIICPKHGEFWQTPSDHLNGKGCPKCAGNMQLDTENFIRRAKEVHGDKYDYSKVEYVNANTKVCIICPEHGEFWTLPNNHLKSECPKCARIKQADSKKMGVDEFICKAKEVHGDKYDYSKVEYVNNSTKVCIICPKHGEFWQTPGIHINNGSGCPKCAKEEQVSRLTSTTEEFIRKAKEVHGDKYDYSKVEYKGCHTKVCIICPEHGEFWQEPNVHLNRGDGCPNCSGLRKQYKFNLLQEFKDEYDFRAFLANNDVNILYVILRNIEPKFDPIKRDIERALAHSNEVDPIKALSDKYTSDSEDELDEDEDEVGNETEDFEIATAPSIDLDDDNTIDSMVVTEATNEADAPTIEDVIKNTEREIKVINKIEHMLTPEDREYIMNKFLNDKRRIWMAARENRK